MIPETVAQVEPHAQVMLNPEQDAEEQQWRQQLAQSVRSPKALLQQLQFSDQQMQQLVADEQGFNTLAPPAYIARMQPGNAQDPLLLQVLPQAAEAIATPDFITDPLAEAQFNPIPGVVHKYHGRALLIAAGHCAINCRYCFRRHYPYNEQQRSRKQWQDSLKHLAKDPYLEEIILSGGDPLALTNPVLFALLDEIEKLPQVKRLRIHSRLPVVLPDRITSALCQRLQNSPLQVIMVLHCNHGQEIDDAVEQACQKLHQADISLLNQTVLLNHINADADVLIALSKRLFKARVLPYYLHLPDHVAGTQHFFVSPRQGQDLMAELQTRLPGYLVPRLVKEEPGRAYKTLIAACTLS
ncbi:MAG: EF-P beta-lysylation protein EpmB [Gammaproteobacteria bacterium]|jgi:EF-P beta-lysylation protein EpmB|nr:EF-P beta-lysylation protein EpmB [Gammaproteobacteria bacterium]